MNVIRQERGGAVLELRSAEPLPAGAYEDVARIFEAFTRAMAGTGQP